MLASAAMAAPFSEPWFRDYQGRVNADREMAVIGTWFSVAISLACDADRAIVRFERGRVSEVVCSPRLDVQSAFGFRATATIWDRYFAPAPPPLYHNVFAMLMRVPGFVLEGDTLVAMQHARALLRAMTLLRPAP
jgi:hypothetical protein